MLFECFLSGLLKIVTTCATVGTKNTHRFYESMYVLSVPRIKEEVDEDEADLTGIGGFDPVLLVFFANMVL